MKIDICVRCNQTFPAEDEYAINICKGCKKVSLGQMCKEMGLTYNAFRKRVQRAGRGLEKAKTNE